MSYLRPSQLDDALARLANKASASVTIAAGGTDLFPATSASKLPGSVLDITAIKDLRAISQTAEGWEFGATTTWTDILRADLPNAFEGLKQAARELGSIQIQNAGTIGGNLCNASPAADGSPCWLTLNANVTLQSINGERTLPLSEFMTGARQTDLQKDELLTKITVPYEATQGHSHFIKLGARKYLVISIVMVAARLVFEDDKISSASIAVGSCSAVPNRLAALEQWLEGQQADPMILDAMDPALIAQSLSPIDDIRADKGYRQEAAVELVGRALKSLIEVKDKLQ